MPTTKKRPNKETTVKISAEELLTNQLIEFFEKGNTFKKDWEDGLISDETYNQTLGDFPLLLENVAPLVALRALRDQLASRVSIGVHKSLDSLNLLSQLDNLNNVLSQQSNMLRESMEAQIKRVLKENPNLKEGTTPHIFLRNMREKEKEEEDNRRLGCAPPR